MYEGLAYDSEEEHFAKMAANTYANQCAEETSAEPPAYTEDEKGCLNLLQMQKVNWFEMIRPPLLIDRAIDSVPYRPSPFSSVVLDDTPDPRSELEGYVNVDSVNGIDGIPVGTYMHQREYNHPYLSQEEIQARIGHVDDPNTPNLDEIMDNWTDAKDVGFDGGATPDEVNVTELVNNDVSSYSDLFESDEETYPTVNIVEKNVERGTHFETWLFDTGATVHVTPNDESLTDVIFKTQTVRVAEGSTVESHKFGNLILHSKCGGSMKLTGVLHVPRFRKHIISGSKLMLNKKYKVELTSENANLIYKKNTLTMKLDSTRNLWFLVGK
jgi:hypothetical protein